MCVNRGHATRGDRESTVTRVCCRKSAAMSLITSGILIRSDGISYWNADARTEIPVPLCTCDPLHFGQMDPSVLRAKHKIEAYRIRSGVDNPLYSTIRLLNLALMHKIQKVILQNQFAWVWIIKHRRTLIYEWSLWLLKVGRSRFFFLLKILSFLY